MNVEPIKRYIPPRYPTYDYFLSHPELLNKVPMRWHGNKLVMSAVCALAMMVNTSKSQDTLHMRPPLTVEANRPVVSMGNMGFEIRIISEIEAQRIIRDEAAKSGIVFKSDSLSVSDVKIPLHFSTNYGNKDTVVYTKKLSLILDGDEKKHKIAYEFVSQEDVNTWRDLDTNRRSANIDAPRTATDLEKELQKQKTGQHIGVFYDPLGNEQVLRKQVDDFIKWLKAEGVI